MGICAGIVFESCDICHDLIFPCIHRKSSDNRTIGSCFAEEILNITVVLLSALQFNLKRCDFSGCSGVDKGFCFRCPAKLRHCICNVIGIFELSFIIHLSCNDNLIFSCILRKVDLLTGCIEIGYFIIRRISFEQHGNLRRIPFTIVRIF